MPVTKEMQRELARKARAANRRLERATEGQRRSLEHNIRGYHTREGARGIVFQQGAAKNEREYRQRMAELEAFMEKSKTSTRRGWEELKKANISKAQESLTNMGYDVTDEELEIILKETGGSSKAFYRALENVMAAKEEADNELTAENIRNAINERRSDYEATLTLQRARRRRNIKKGLL